MDFFTFIFSPAALLITAAVAWLRVFFWTLSSQCFTMGWNWGPSQRSTLYGVPIGQACLNYGPLGHSWTPHRFFRLVWISNRNKTTQNLSVGGYLGGRFMMPTHPRLLAQTTMRKAAFGWTSHRRCDTKRLRQTVQTLWKKKKVKRARSNVGVRNEMMQMKRQCSERGEGIKDDINCLPDLLN